MVKRVLITTALEETWPNDNSPVVFLGEWARLYSRRSLWSQMDAEVVPYHWDDRVKLRKDYLYLNGLYETVLIELSLKLNEVHAVNHDVRYWRILVGPWLGYFIQILFDRWYMLDYTIANFAISSVYSLEQSAENVVPQHMEHFQKMFVDDKWNESIYSQILKVISGAPLLTVRRAVCNNINQHNGAQSLSTFMFRLKSAFKYCLEYMFKVTGRNDSLFLISSYLSFKTSFLLQIKMKQLPKFWSATVVPFSSLDENMRSIVLEIAPSSNVFETLLKSLLIKNIPLSYLEGYKNLQEKVEHSPWPKYPKLIFTSNSFLTDDLFKAWTAEKVEKGSKLIIGQHGGNFGTALFGFCEEHQISISDFFFSWGWVNKNRLNIVPIGNFVLEDKTQKGNINGELLLVTLSLPRYSYHLLSLPVASQFIDYQEEQYRFVYALPLAIRNKLLVRLYTLNFGWCEKERWINQFPECKLDEGIVKLPYLISTSRIFVATYNATTFLESLNLNIPTIIFWNPHHSEFDERAIPYFSKLKEAGIFHESPESAALKVAEIWDDVAGWWTGFEVQDARNYFCNYFSRKVLNPVDKLYNNFTELLQK